MIYDLAILGGGPAGYSAALEGVKLGLSVVLFEEKQLGGTCLNRGCVPTKFLLHVSKLYDEMNNASDYGFNISKFSFDLSSAMEKKKNIVMELQDGLCQLLLKKKITIIEGMGKLLDETHITCKEELYEAKNILIATGSLPASPLFDGALSSDDILELKELPKSIKIIGGGVVAVEFAYILNCLGVKVTLCIRGNRVLRKWDKELSVGLTQFFKKRDIKILTKCSIEQMQEYKSDITLMAVGRTANLNGINLELVDLDNYGSIKVTKDYMTTTQNIYAAGDVISGSPMLAHTAMEQGKYIVHKIVGDSDLRKSVVIKWIYTEPEIAQIGITEAEAKEKGMNFVSAKINMCSNARSLISGKDRRFIKILADKNTEKIIGASLMCDRATDIAGELALAMNANLTLKETLTTVRPHPSFSEAITDAAEILKDKLNEF